MKLWIGACPWSRVRAGVAKDAFVRSEAVAHMIAQNAVLIEAVEAVGPLTTRDTQRSSLEKLLKLAHHTKHTESLVHVNVV